MSIPRKRSRSEFEACDVKEESNMCFKHRRIMDRSPISTNQLACTKFPDFVLKDESFNGILLDTNSWVKTIVDDLLLNVKCGFHWKNDMTCLRVNVWGNNEAMQLIPQVPVEQMHLLPKSAQQCLILACISGPQKFHQQFAFKSHYDKNLPFMIVFQTNGNNITNMNNEIKINGTVIKLTKIGNKSTA